MFKRLFLKKLLAIGLSVIVMGYCVQGFGQERRLVAKKVVVPPPPRPQPPRPQHRPPQPRPRRKPVVIWHRGGRYFYHGGVFYRYRGYPPGYVVVRAPVGAIVAALAVGFTTLVIGGLTYYHYGGVHYQKVPSGYVVVEPPPGAVVPQEPPAAIQPPETVSDRVSVTAHNLNVRSGPGRNHPVVDQVSQGNILVIQGSAPGWLYVQLPSGKFGWVSEEFTAPVFPPASG
jgi:hypothetical protein